MDFSKPTQGASSAHTSDEWRRVVQAIEDSALVYESISENISFNLAGPLRRRAIALLVQGREGWVLDSGAGPGVSSRLLISQGFQNIIGLDPSRKLLTYAKTKLGPEFNPVIAIGENLPFKEETIQNILTCFALRDARDLEKSLAEFHRSMKDRAQLCIVDIGKPDRTFQRIVISLYIQRVMPILARLLVRNRIPSNPFKMIVPTFKKLPTNKNLTAEVEANLGPSRLKEFMQGGLILLEAKRGNPRIALAKTSRLPKSGNSPK